MTPHLSFDWVFELHRLRWGATFSRPDKLDEMQKSGRMFWFRSHRVITAQWQDVKPPAVPQSTRKKRRQWNVSEEADCRTAETVWLKHFHFEAADVDTDAAARGPLAQTERLELSVIITRHWVCWRPAGKANSNDGPNFNQKFSFIYCSRATKMEFKRSQQTAGYVIEVKYSDVMPVAPVNLSNPNLHSLKFQGWASSLCVPLIFRCISTSVVLKPRSRA